VGKERRRGKGALPSRPGKLEGARRKERRGGKKARRQTGSLPSQKSSSPTKRRRNRDSVSGKRNPAGCRKGG